MTIWLWHEGRDIALLASEVADRVLEREVVVDGANRIRVSDRHFVLTGAVLLADLRDGHVHCAELVDEALDEDPLRGKTGLAEHPCRVDRLVVRAISRGGTEQVELWLERHLR